MLFSLSDIVDTTPATSTKEPLEPLTPEVFVAFIIISFNAFPIPLFEDADYENCVMIVLPGGLPGTTNLAKHEGLVRNIQAFAAKEKWLAAICAAPGVLGKLSLLEGKNATIYPGLEEQMIGAKHSEDRVVQDGKFITSRGPGTATDFALKLVEVLKSKHASDEVRAAMLVC